MLARLGETWVITRENNRSAIELAIASLPEEERPRFVYVDLPRWARFWKRGQRGIRVYYMLWQVAALRRGRECHRREHFDLVWHITLANIWLGSLGAMIGPRFVYGPVGGGDRSCWDPRIVGLRGALYEIGRSAAVWTGRYANPIARVSWRRAALILANNEATVRWLPGRYRSRAEVMPNVALDLEPQPHRAPPSRRVALFAGRLHPLKGGALAIRAMQHLPEWHLLICGTGPDEHRLRRLTQKLNVSDRVSFEGWIPRDDLFRLIREQVGVLLFPSLHDQAGWIVGEALTLGVPAVSLDRGGPPALGATCVPLRGPTTTARLLADAVRRIDDGPLPRWDITSRYRRLEEVLASRGVFSRIDR
jgi:glycosyltransferase involved in cell wall biosynthesis